LIAASGIAVGIGIKSVLRKREEKESGEDDHKENGKHNGKENGKDKGLNGTLIVLGTPAEEGGGGKIKLLGKGIAENNVVSSLMFVHRWI
jgi:hypothetical protein